jgi:hypothetical protein
MQAFDCCTLPQKHKHRNTTLFSEFFFQKSNRTSKNRRKYMKAGAIQHGICLAVIGSRRRKENRENR